MQVQPGQLHMEWGHRSGVGSCCIVSGSCGIGQKAVAVFAIEIAGHAYELLQVPFVVHDSTMCLLCSVNEHSRKPSAEW